MHGNNTVQMKMFAILLIALLAAPARAETNTCSFQPWGEYEGDRLLSHPEHSAYIFSTPHIAVDADGAPNAYHPDDTGLDYLANAGYPDSRWWKSVLVEDPDIPGEAYRQPAGPYAGYFVSKTSLQDTSKHDTDTSRYVDAARVPYLVFPGAFYQRTGTGRLGDLGYAFNLSTGDASAFVVADIGPRRARLGEISIALAEGLGGENVNPRSGAGAPSGTILYVVFPYSSRSNPWPLTNDAIADAAETLLGLVGGREDVIACERTLPGEEAPQDH